MPQQWCERCWTMHKLRTPAEWDIDGDLHCSPCKKSVGYEDTKGVRLVGASVPSAVADVSSADPQASPGSLTRAIHKAFLPKPDKRAKAHAELVPIPERLERALSQDVPRRTKELPAMERRTCSVEGCTKRITLENKSGRCSAHWYVPKKQRGAQQNSASAVKPRLPPLAAAKRNEIIAPQQSEFHTMD